jgi:hypothetical protein
MAAVAPPPNGTRCVMAANEDKLLRFLREFASMSEQERDAAIEGLSEEDRDALVALQEARAAAAEADLIEVLDSGHTGLDKLREVTDPAHLLTVINLAARERPRLFAEALFAAVVLYRGWDAAEPTAIAELREQWHWHVHEQRLAHETDREGGDV